MAALVAVSPAAAQKVSGEIGVVSDYRYRGLSLSGGNPAVQGSLTFEQDSGWYAQAWFSTLGSSDPAASEIDLSGGFAKGLSDHLGIDISATFFAYPDAPADAYFEATAAATLSRGQASARLGFSVVPPQRATGHDANAYAFGEAELALPHVPLTVKAAIGYERGAFDEAADGGKWDWTLGGDLKLGPARFALAYTGSDVSGSGRHALLVSLFGEF
jgi:uncharacterized protein (TIGR02001 family)